MAHISLTGLNNKISKRFSHCAIVRRIIGEKSNVKLKSLELP